MRYYGMGEKCGGLEKGDVRTSEGAMIGYTAIDEALKVGTDIVAMLHRLAK